MGLALEQEGKTKDAIDAYEHALHLQSPSMDLLSHLGPLYVDDDRPNDAVRIFRVGIEKDPSDNDFLQEVLDGLRSIVAKHPKDKDAVALVQELFAKGILEQKQ